MFRDSLALLVLVSCEPETIGVTASLMLNLGHPMGLYDSNMMPSPTGLLFAYLLSESIT